MSLPVPLSVTLETSRRAMRITRQVRDLQFRTVVPGGYADCTISLHRPLTYLPDEIAYYGRLYVHDARNGKVVWEGRVEDPGRSAGGDGTVWKLVAIGPSAHVEDHRQVYVMIDQSLPNWERSTTWSEPGSRTTVTDVDDGDTPALLLEAPEGTTVPTGWTADMIYRHIKTAGQTVARLACEVDNGNTASWENRLVTRLSSGTIVDSAAWSTSPAALAASIGSGTPIPAGDNVAHVRITRTGGTITATAASWAEFTDVVILAVRMDASGNDITSGYSAATSVLASDVVTDVLGRMLPQFDGPNAVVATTGYGIEQFAFIDSATPGEILDALMEFEPGYFWAAWESGSTGLYRFEWKAWPGSVCYEVDVTDGIEAPGSAVDLYNRVKVRYRDGRGAIRVIERTQVVPELAAAGINRTGWVDLGDEVGGRQAQAERAGDQFLLDHRTPLNQGSLRISRPILDRTAGLKVQPWEILPGTIIRVRGIQPDVDTLNRSDRNGVSIFKVISVEYDAGSATATLELDSWAPSLARQIARLTRARERRLRKR